MVMFVALLWCFLCSSCDVCFVSAYSQQGLPAAAKATVAAAKTTAGIGDRRRFFAKTMTSVAASGIVAASLATLPQGANAAEGESGEANNNNNAAVLPSKFCAYGEGNDCEDLAEGNPFILELQRKSAANKQANIDSAKNAYYAKNYPDFFAAVGKTMVQKESDGTFIVVDKAELAKLWDDNKISVTTPTTMGGKIKDVTQKPMLVLKE
jgi:hypothetical protein